MKIENTSTYIAAFILLLTMALIAFFSMREDSLTFDEMSHIPDGYSYLVKRDYRLNPEHPPLVKDLAALPLLFMNLNFPDTGENWKTWTPDQQWRFGPEFLYRAGNDPDKIVFASRIPMIGLLIVLGIFIFKWARKLAGNKAALIALTLFAFSPTFIAHGRLVTTDVAAALGFVISAYFFFVYLAYPSRKNLILSGIVLGISLLLKFTIAIIIPYIVCVWMLFFAREVLTKWKTVHQNQRILYFARQFARQSLNVFVIFAVAFVIIGIVYSFHVSGYKKSEQRLHTEKTVAMYSPNPTEQPIYQTLIWASDKPVLRAYEQYFLGVTMNIKRASYGNTTFFLGDVSAAGWRSYFPIVYAIKVPIALHAITFLTLMLWISWFIRKSKENLKRRAGSFIKSRAVLISLFIFVLLYWLISITSNLNIGVRHILPAFPFTYLLISVTAAKWIDESLKGKRMSIAKIITHPFISLCKYAIIFVLLFWYIGSAIKSYPFYISYFNGFVGGGTNGHKYAVDSNLDWGQDFKRLERFIQENQINSIHLDYFGGADASYYLGDKFVPWWSDLGRPKGYFAISLTKLKGTQAKPVKGFKMHPEETYSWLRGETPVAKIGHSIWVYKFD